MKAYLKTIPALAAALWGCAAQKAERPNIIYIMFDDLGYGDLGCYGQELIETPNIDSLAARGIVFTDMYSASPLSAPSRCSVMTGLHSGHSQIRGNDERWAGFREPGHWPDADMLVLGKVGWGRKMHWTQLSPWEQYTHITLWAILASPMLLGCDMALLDPFTLSLLCNNEVLDVNQDPLGVQGVRFASGEGHCQNRPEGKIRDQRPHPRLRILPSQPRT